MKEPIVENTKNQNKNWSSGITLKLIYSTVLT